jgi:hypothetical protein
MHHSLNCRLFLEIGSNDILYLYSEQLIYPPSQKATGLLVDECGAG